MFFVWTKTADQKLQITPIKTTIDETAASPNTQVASYNCGSAVKRAGGPAQHNEWRIDDYCCWQKRDKSKNSPSTIHRYGMEVPCWQHLVIVI